MKYTYSIQIPFLDGWNTIITDTMSYCLGYMRGSKGHYPGTHYRMVRSDGKIIDEILPNESVSIGMVAGFPTAEQYERAGNEALEKAKKIRETLKTRKL